MWVHNIHQAKTHLSELIQHALKGEEVIICKAGIPVVTIHRYKKKVKPRVPGMWKGKVSMSKDFDELPEEILNYFQGKEERALNT